MAEAQPEDRFYVRGPAGRLAGRFCGVADAGGTHSSRGAALPPPSALWRQHAQQDALSHRQAPAPAELAIPCLRFDFRGAGESEGEHDGGRGELEDTRRALAELRRRVGARGGVPLIGIGHSFGAAVGLHALAEEEGVERLVGLGLPLRFDWDLSFLLDVKQACFFVQGEDDEFGSPAELDAFATRMSAPVEISIIPGASHLFSAVEDRAVDSVVGHLARHYPANP